MSGSNRVIVILLPVLALVAAFWFLVLGPKREEASKLEDEAAGLLSQVDEQEQVALAAEEARRDFPKAYRRLVVMGKATPNDDDTASLLVQLDEIAAESGVKFLSLKASESAGSAESGPPAGAPETPAGAAESSQQRVETAEAGPMSAPPAAAATEASAASLPIGASVGPAGLPVMKHNLAFEGDFVGLSDFLAGVDRLVRSRSDGTVGIRGRLITVDKFEISPVGEPGPDPLLSATFEVTTYLIPAEEGPTGGADPAGPAPVTEAQPATGAPAPPPSEIASATTP